MIATGIRQTVPVRGEDPWAPPDLLGEAPHVLRMSGTRSELTAPWGLTLSPDPDRSGSTSS